MQLGQLLAVLNPTPATGIHSAAGTNADGGAADHTFAQLLGDAGAKNAASDHGKQNNNSASDHESDMSASPASTALVAQELTKNAAEDAAALAAKIAQPITPDEATTMLARLESKGATGASIEKLKQALVAIRDGGAQESIGSLVQKLVEAKQATTPADTALMIQQTLHALAPEPAATDEQTEANAASPDTIADSGADSNLLSVLAQSLQASFFRTVDSKSSNASSHTSKQERKESREVVEITPLSAILVTNAAQLQGVAAPVVAEATSAIGQASSVIAGINNDSRIPSLALAPASKEGDALPEEKNHPDLDALAALKSTNDTRLNAVLDAAKASVAARSDNIVSMPASAPTDSAAKATAAATATAATAAATATAATAAATTAMAANALAASTVKSSGNANAVANPAATPAVAETSAVNTNGVKPLSDVMALSNAKAAVAETVVGEKPTEEKPLDAKLDNTLADVKLNGTETQVVAPHNTAASAVKMATNVPIPVPEQVHVAVSHAMKTGVKDLTIQLDPIDLGRVEVKMHTNSDGQTQITFMVDKPSTLDSLARSAHGLERSLQEAGVKTDAGNMQFNLRQQPQSADTNAGGNNNRQSSNQSLKEDAVAPVGSTKSAAISAITTRNYTLNIRDGLDIHA